jgi:hypothetical protein
MPDASVTAKHPLISRQNWHRIAVSALVDSFLFVRDAIHFRSRGGLVQTAPATKREGVLGSTMPLAMGGQALEKAQNGNGQLLGEVGMDLNLAPLPLGCGATSVWGWRRARLGLAPRPFGIDGTMPTVNAIRANSPGALRHLEALAQYGKRPCQ